MGGVGSGDEGGRERDGEREGGGWERGVVLARQICQNATFYHTSIYLPGVSVELFHFHNQIPTMQLSPPIIAQAKMLHFPDVL